MMTDYVAQRFAHAYVRTGDPMKAAMTVGFGRTDSGWDYDAAEKIAVKLLEHPMVVGHLNFLLHKYNPNLRLDYEKFSSLISEMVTVTFDNFFVWNPKIGDYALKPFFMLSKAELMCLEDV